MSDIAKQITELSVEKRQLLERYLKSAGLDLTSAVIIPQPRDTNKFPSKARSISMHYSEL
jgi:hypothetical protein